MHNTRKAWIFKHVCEKERCMGKPKSTPCHKENECTRVRITHGHKNLRLTYTHRRQIFECLCERTGAWASPNTPLSQDTWTSKQGLHKHPRHESLNVFVKGEVQGQARTLPVTRHRNTQERFTLTHKTQKFECLCERRGAWASPKCSLVTRHTASKAKFGPWDKWGIYPFIESKKIK